jgi:hypothetical protein
VSGQQEIVEHGLRIRAVVKERGDHHRPAALGCERFQKGQRSLPALGEHKDPATRFAHGSNQRSHLALVGEPRRHRQAAFAIVRGRSARREADGAGLHRLAHDRLHLRDFVVGRHASRRVFAQHEGAHAAVADVGRDVHRAALAAKHFEVLRKRFEVPGDALPQHVERHTLDMREIAHRAVAIRRLARRDGEAAVADDRGRHSQRRRGSYARVPGDLRIEVGMAVDDAGHQRKPVGVDRPPSGCGNVAIDLADSPISNRHIQHRRRRTGAVEDERISEQEIVHAGRSAPSAYPVRG